MHNLIITQIALLSFSKLCWCVCDLALEGFLEPLAQSDKTALLQRR